MIEKAAISLYFISLFLIVYSYIIYPVILRLFSAFWGKDVRFDRNYFPEVCVFIPAFNEENVIEQKILNVLSIDYPADRISVVVASDKSNDNTEAIVKGFDDERVKLWVAPKRMGKTGLINRVVPGLHSELVLMTDANTMHNKDSLRRMTGYFTSPEIGGVAGRIVHTFRNHKEDAESIYRSLEVFLKQNEAKLHSTISAFGGFYLIRQVCFRKIPYNSYSNDDVLVPMNIIRQRKRVLFEQSAVSSEDTTADIKEEYERRVRIGTGNFQSFSWLYDFLNPLRGWPAFCYVSHKVMRWFSPFFILLFIIMQTILMLSVDSVFFTGTGVIVLIFLFFILLFWVTRIRLFRPFYYFAMMNIAIIHGFFKFLDGVKSAYWDRTER